MKKKQNEKRVVKEFMRRAKAEVGGFWWKVHGSIFQMTGLPDVCGCVRGLYCAPEFKDGNNKPSPPQKTRVKQIREAGGWSGIFWDADLAIRSLKRHVKNFALQEASKSRKVIQKPKADRIIHGARDWEDHYRIRLHRSKKRKN